MDFLNLRKKIEEGFRGLTGNLGNLFKGATNVVQAPVKFAQQQQQQAAQTAIQNFQKAAGGLGQGIRGVSQSLQQNVLNPAISNAQRNIGALGSTLSQAGKTLQNYDTAVRQRNLAQLKSDIEQYRTSPATAILQTPVLSPFGGISQTFKGYKVATGQEPFKIDFTQKVQDVEKFLSPSTLEDNGQPTVRYTDGGYQSVPVLGKAIDLVGEVIKPPVKSAARMLDVAQTQEQYAPGWKGAGQLGSDIFNVGTTVYSGGAFKNLAQASAPEAAKILATGAAKTFPSGFTQSVLQQMQDTGKAPLETDLTKAATAGAVYTGLAGALPLASKGLTSIRNAAAKKVQTAAANAAEQAVNKAYAQPVTEAVTTTAQRNIQVPGTKAVAEPTVVSPIKVGTSETPQVAPENIDLTPKQGLITKAKAAIFETDAAVIDRLREIEKTKNVTGLVDNYFINSGLATRSNAMANQFMRSNTNLNTALKGLDNNSLDSFNAYSAARAELNKYKPGMKTSMPVEDLQNIVNQFDNQFGQRYQALNGYYKDLAKIAYEGGKIDEATYRRFLSDNDYTRIQRDMEDVVAPRGISSGTTSSGKSYMARQKYKGSERQVLPADATAFQTAQQVFSEVAKNKSITDLVNVLAENGNARVLVKADDVLFRRDMWSFLKDSRPIKEFFSKELRTSNRELRSLYTQINQLNKRGLNIRLGQKATPSPEVSAFRYKNVTEAPNVQRVSEPNIRTIGAAREVTGTARERLAIERGATSNDIRKLMQDMITTDPAELRRVKNMIATRDAKAADLLERTAQLQEQLADVNAARKQAYTMALGRADQATRNKNTVRRTVNGIEEVWEVPADVKEVVDKIRPYELRAYERIISFPKRLLQAGTTGLSIPFAAKNFIRDQVGAAINSKDARATFFHPAAMIGGLWNASKDFAKYNNDPIWQKFLSYSGDITQFDMLRNADNAAKLSKELRLGQKGKLINMTSTPGGVINSLEDFVSITEKATRFQNFKGMYNSIKKANPKMPDEEAFRQAALSAWQNSVDFNRYGSAGRFLNLIIPYFNSSIQGSRQLMRSFRDRPVATAIKSMAFVGAPLIAATMYSLSNPEIKKVYDNIPDYEKENNIIFIPPGGTMQNEDGTYNIMKIPLPPGYGQLMTPFRRAAESFATASPVEFGKIANDIVTSISGPIDTSSVERTVGALTPQAIKPLVQQAANKDFFTGKAIVPEYIQESTDAQGRPIAEKLKAYKYTSGSSKVLGGLTGISPIRIDKFIKDTFGKSGQYTQNALDTIMAQTGLISKESVGGISPVSDVVRAFTKVQGTENYMKSEGAKYFDDVKSVTKEMTKPELDAFNTLFPIKKNFLGDEIYQPNKVYDPVKRLALYNQFPKVYEAAKQLNQKSTERGNPSNPFFDLPFDQARKVLEKEALPPGAQDLELSKLYQQEWFSDYKQAKKDYFDAIKRDSEAKGIKFDTQDNPYPETPPQLQAAMDIYSNLPKKTGARSNWIRNNPQIFEAMKAQWALVDDWQNVQRGKRGLAPTEGQAGIDAGFRTASTYGTGKGGKTYIPNVYVPYIRGTAQKPGGLRRPSGARIKPSPTTRFVANRNRP